MLVASPALGFCHQAVLEGWVLQAEGRSTYGHLHATEPVLAAASVFGAQ